MNATETARIAIVGIDPGSSSGAMSLWDGKSPAVVNMPEDFKGIFDLLHAACKMYDEVKIVMENVGGSRPGNAAKAARTFSEHVGGLKMACVALGITPTMVVPRKWMVSVCGYETPTGSSPEAKKERKKYIYDKMCWMYPDTKITKRQADAVAIMHYGRTLHEEGLL